MYTQNVREPVLGGDAKVCAPPGPPASDLLWAAAPTPLTALVPQAQLPGPSDSRSAA